MLTQLQGQLALAHIMERLFQFTDTDPLPLALTAAGYADIRDVITMTQEEIDALTYEDTDEDGSTTIINVPVPAKSYLRILKAYHAHRYADGDPIGNNWTSITAEEFDTFHVEDYNIITMGSSSGLASQRILAPSSSTVPRPRDPVADFKKGIKRDPSLFLAFKMEWQWVSWQHSTLAQARAQDVADVLDPAYASSLPEERLLFEEKQKYLYAVFEQKLQTDKGKDLVHEYETTSDAQAVYAALLEHYTNSVKASLDQCSS